MSHHQVIHLLFQSPSRGYTMTVERDLFGTPVLYRRWYGLSSRRGGGKMEVFLSEEALSRAIGKVRRARERRGYVLVSPLDEH